jgi:putative ABC transport system substrate-binding protein
LEYRYGNNDYGRLPALAAELVSLNVSVIVANGTPASLAAKQATTRIPIVMVETADPIGSKLVSSLAKPGGNITGVAQLVSAASVDTSNPAIGGQGKTGHRSGRSRPDVL